MKKAVFFIFLILPCCVYAQDQPTEFNFGRFSFFQNTALMEDGTINNAGFGLGYTDVWGGEIRGRAIKTSKNEESDDSSVSDSLIAIKETVYELYFLPIRYKFTAKQNSIWRIGAGLYYEYQESEQKGHIEMPALASLGLEQVNSFADDFTAHIIGPLVDIGFEYGSEWFRINFSGGVVPAYFLSASETQRMFPLFDTVEHTQDTWGSPYFYLSLDSVLFKYLSLTLKYNYARFKYDIIDFDYDAQTTQFIPIFPESSITSQSVMFEIAAVLPLGVMGFQIGYGHMVNISTPDSGNEVRENKHYLTLAGKKIGF